MNAEEQVSEYIESREEEIVGILRDLVAIPTVNPPGECYRECVDYLSGLLRSWHVEHRALPIAQESHPRFAVFGGWGEGEDKLHFHGHYDVVVPQSPGQFRLRERNGRLYGRGTSDMKGGIAAFLFALRALQECGVRLPGKITFTLVPDEETGGRLGMRHLAEAGLLPSGPLGMLMPEPSGGGVWHACRGALSLRVRVRGKLAHVGLPHRGVNAFEAMVRVMQSLLELKEEIVARRTSVPVAPPEADRSVIVLGGESGSGLNFNTVPENAWFSIDRRINPEESLEDARRELDEVFERHRAEGIDIVVETLQEGEPALAPADSPLARVLARTVEDVSGTAPRFELCPGILETRFFTNRGIPGYGYGPGLLEVSHGPDEYVETGALLECTKVYALTALRLLR